MRTKKTRLAEWAFQDMKAEHKRILLTHLMKLMKGINEDQLTEDEMIQTMKGILVSMVNLKKSKQV